MSVMDVNEEEEVKLVRNEERRGTKGKEQAEGWPAATGGSTWQLVIRAHPPGLTFQEPKKLLTITFGEQSKKAKAMTAFISVNSPSERGPGTQSEQEKAPTIFVTVGSTRFDALIAAVLDRSFLRLLASSSLSSSSPPHLKIQYGASDLTSILLSSAIAQQDEGSALQYEPGLRVVGGERIYSHKNKKLDPGMTGTICLRLRAAPGAPRTVQSDSETIPPSKEDLDLDLGLDDAQDDEPFVPQPLEASSMGDGVLEGTTEEGVHLELFQYAPSLTDHMRASDVVICHAGQSPQIAGIMLQAD